MINKLKAITVVILVIAIVGVGLHLNKIATSQQALTSNTEETKSQDLSDAENGTINAKIKVEGANVLGVAENGLKFGEDWSEVPDAQVPADPTKKLSSGSTLLEAKAYIDMQRKRCVERGNTPEEVTEIVTAIAINFGTTIAEVNRLQVAPESAVKPAEKTQPSGGTVKPNQPTQQTQPSSNEDLTGTPGAFTKTDWDQNGDGINDDLAENTAEPTGTTSDPNFNIKAH